MTIHLALLGAGILVGVVDGLINVRSPAPPVIAWVGPLGIRIGERIIPIARHVIAGESIDRAIGLADCRNHQCCLIRGKRASTDGPPVEPPSSS